VTRSPKLSRLLTLEERVATPDGAGGHELAWRALGSMWAEVTARAAREDFIAGRPHARTSLRITVRAAPMGAASRPPIDPRFRDGDRVFNILAVAEADARARYLEIFAEEGVLP
jgi:head-tail adaptor